MKAYRQQLGLSQKEMAEILGIHRNSMARMERGEMAITGTLSRFVRLLSERAKVQSLTSLLRIMEGD
jgi:transcriptional regulator with XRE-family HTH domain